MISLWCWITANSEPLQAVGSIVGAVLSFLVGVISALVSIVAWKAANRSADAAARSADVAQTTANISILTSRPYLVMSHDEDGLFFRRDADPEKVRVKLNIQIKNFGKTPANITRVHLQTWPGPLSEQPTYLPNDTAAHLVLSADDHVFHPLDAVIARAEFEKIKENSLEFYVLGYVDYADRFGGRHQSRYARKYSHSTRTLSFVGHESYNDDVPQP